MQDLDLKWLAPVSLLRSDRWLNTYLQSKSQVLSNSEDLAKVAIGALTDYGFYSNNPYRKEDLEFSLKSWVNLDNTQWLNFDFVTSIHNHFLVWLGDRFEVKPTELELWSAVISKIDPVWILARAYSELLYQEVITPNQLPSFLSNQCASAFSKSFGGKSIADNHVHLGGNGHASLSLLDFSLYLTKKPKNTDWPALPEMNLFNSGELPVSNLPLVVNSLCSDLITSSVLEEDKSCYSKINLADMDLWRPDESLLFSLDKLAPKNTAQKVVKASHVAKSCSPHSRWLMLAIGLTYNDRYQIRASKERYQFRAYMIACNLFRSAMISSGVGLGQFVDYFGFKYRKPIGNEHIEGYGKHALKVDGDINVHREFKVSPGIVLDLNKKKILGINPKSLIKSAKEIIQQGREDNVQFAIHFSRSFNGRSTGVDRLQKKKREELLQQTRKFQQFFSSAGWQDQKVSSFIDSNGSVDLTRLIRGLDVAGNENDLGIEFFSPAIRVIRSAKAGSTSNYFKPTRSLHLTIHAGEDYSHLLSGMRAMDETVEYCNYREGDRIGHGLALGVDSSQWAKRQGHIFVTACDHLDNLVWCYHQAVKVTQLSSGFSAHIPVLVQKIEHWSKYVYGTTYSPNDLYLAWTYRRNCPLMSELPSRAAGVEWESWVPDMLAMNVQNQTVAYRIWQQYVYSNQFSERHPRFNDVISIECLTTACASPLPDAENRTDTITLAELNLFTAIQDLKIQDYSQRGIILEACPTSNVYIGRLKEYREHPIYRWFPVSEDDLAPGAKHNQFGLRNGPITVCVNTDDAALMPTTIENEHRILKETAIKELGVGNQAAEEWINSIREIGVDIFRSNHLDWVNKKV